MAKYCVNCGCAMDENSTVCLNCGTAAYDPAAEAKPQPAAAPAQINYAPPAQDAYAPPAQDAYAPPAQDAYAPPAQDAYAPPVQNVYTPPAQDAYAPAPAAPQAYPAGSFAAPSAGQYTPAPAYTAAPPAAQPKKGGKKVVVIAVIAALLVLGIVLAVVLSKGGSGKPDAPIEAMCKAIETGRATYVIDCLPEVYSGDKEELSEMKSEAREDISDIYDEIVSEFGTGFKMSYTVLSDVTVTGSELADCKSMLPNVTEVHDLTVRLKVTSASGEVYEWDGEDIRVYKQSGKWVFLW